MLKILSFSLLIIYFAVLLLIVFREKQSKNTLDFFFAGRSMPFWALSITFIASWWGAGSALETADYAYREGMSAFWIYGMPVLASTFIMILGSAFIRRIGYLTQGQIMQARYSSSTSKILAIMILFFMTLNAAVQMVGIGEIFSAYLGINYGFAVILGTFIVIIYSVFGGFKGVVITDIIQFILLFISALIVLVVAVYYSGGVVNIYDKALIMRDENFFSFSYGFEKNMVFVITFGLSWVIQANVWQRISAAKNQQDATKMAVMSFFVYIPLYLLVVFTGMAATALFTDMPKGGVITAIVTEYMHPVLGAFVFLGLSAAVMSTMDSLINTAAMTISLDIAPKNYSDEKRLVLSKLSTLIIAIVAIFLALAVRSILKLTFVASDIITSGVFIPLILGFFWKRGNSYGANAYMIFGVIFAVYNLLIVQGLNLPVFYKVQSAWQAITGICISVLIYVFVSLVTKNENHKINDLKTGYKGE